jgi:hypothetical protein
MSDFEFKLQKWLLAIVILIATGLLAINQWFRPLSAGVATQATAQASDNASRVQAAAATPADPHVAEPQPATEEVDAGLPVITLEKGRTLRFAKTAKRRQSYDWPVTDIIHPWLFVDGGQQVSLPPIPSERDQFTPLVLLDGRLALIGGRTPRDLLAQEGQCAGCPDEYIPFGEPIPSITTDILDIESATWSKGPNAARPANAAIRLRDGSIVKVNLESDGADSEHGATHVYVETSDIRFTRWETDAEARCNGWFSLARVFESHDGAVLLLAGEGGTRAYHWKVRGKLEQWLEGEIWDQAEQVDEGHLQLTSNLDVYPPRSEKRIVELP